MENQTWTPKLLVRQLKKSIIGQDRYLKDLCSCVWIHSLKKQAQEQTGYEPDGPKLNLLVIGKSGTGKTLAIQSLAKLLDLNLVIEDASLFTGAGWKGRETVSIAKDLLLSANKNRKKAEYSIVVLDEMDKLFLDTQRTGSFSAVNNFLKLIEGTEIEYVEDNYSYHLNTKNILFICLGAFEGLEEIIIRRMQKSGKIGFCTDRQTLPRQNLLQYVRQEDLIAYGVNPQFLGRMAALTVTNDLTEEDYFQILKNSDVCAINQYNTLLKASLGVNVRITSSAARHLAQKAIKEQTGGRALLFEITKMLKEGIYQISQRPDVNELLIDVNVKNKAVLRFIKGKRKAVLSHSIKKTPVIIQEQWKNIPLNLTRYHHSFAGACQCAEDMAETLELYDGLLSFHYSYRQIKAAVCLISCAVLFIMAADLDETVYDVACTVKMIIGNPPERQNSYERKDAFAAMYWKSISYEKESHLSMELTMYILQEYCRHQIQNEMENKAVS